jgi:hypothetical protein
VGERPQAADHGLGCTSTLGGRGDGSERDERRITENATAPTASPAAAAIPAISQGRLLRR